MTLCIPLSKKGVATRRVDGVCFIRCASTALVAENFNYLIFEVIVFHILT